jgi:hypothetical protein
MKKSLDTFININLDSIPFNIWDDYYGDGCGKIQETHGYIEESDELNEEQKEEICSLVFNRLKS